MSAREIAAPIRDRVLKKLQQALADEHMNDLPLDVRYRVKDYVLVGVYRKMWGWIETNQKKAEA